MAGHWLFVCNPERWDIWSYLASGRGLRSVSWNVKRFRNRVEPGDDAVLWLTGAHRGVYAVGRVLTRLHTDTGGEFWTDPADATREFQVVDLDLGPGLFGSPILAEDLLEDPRFATASIIHQPFAAIPHRLTGEEWLAIIERVHLG